MQNASNPTPRDASLQASTQSQSLVSPWQTLVILFGAPLAWLMQMWLSEPIAAHACFPRVRSLDHPLFSHLSLTIFVIGIVALGAALASTGLAWRLRQRMLQDSDKPHAQRFVIEIGLLASAACSIAVVFTLAAVLLVSPCAPW